MPQPTPRPETPSPGVQNSGPDQCPPPQRLEPSGISDLSAGRHRGNGCPQPMSATPRPPHDTSRGDRDHPTSPNLPTSDDSMTLEQWRSRALLAETHMLAAEESYARIQDDYERVLNLIIETTTNTYELIDRTRASTAIGSANDLALQETYLEAAEFTSRLHDITQGGGEELTLEALNLLSEMRDRELNTAHPILDRYNTAATILSSPNPSQQRLRLILAIYGTDIEHWNQNPLQG